MTHHAKALANIKTMFADVLSPADIFMPQSGRPYIKVATKGSAVLLANVDFDVTCWHPPVEPGTEQKHVKAYGICVRFFQRGGGVDSFSPPLTVRAKDDEEKLYRLSKHTFPLCLPSVNPSESWANQQVSSSLLTWLKGIAEFAGAVSSPNMLLTEVINMNKDMFIGQKITTEFFSLDVQTSEEHTSVEGMTEQ